MVSDLKLWRIWLLNGYRQIAIIIACLVSFRALFTQPDRSHPPAKKVVDGITSGPYRPMAEVNSIGEEGA